MVTPSPDWTPRWRYRVLCLAVLAWGCWQYLQGGLLHQLVWSYSRETGRLVAGHYAGIDPAYAVLHGSGLFGLLIQPKTALLATWVLGGLLAWQSLRPTTWVAWVLLLFAWAYGLAINAALGYPAHGTYGPMLALGFGIWAAGQHGKLAADGFRYVAAFPMASAAVYKIVQGALFDIGSMSDLLRWQHAGLFMQEPWPIALGHTWMDLFSEGFILWLVDHPIACSLGFLFVFLIQLVFIGAFLTKRLDPLYVWLLPLFIVIIGLAMRLDFSGLLVLCVFFVRTRKTVPSSSNTSIGATPVGD